MEFLQPTIEDHRDDLRDHVASPLQHDGVADADILAPDLVLIVQCGAADQDAADVDRLKFCHRRQRAGAADLDTDFPQHGGGLFGGELPGDGPTRRAPDKAETALQPEVVYLVDDTVDVVAEAGSGETDFALEGFGVCLAVEPL